MVALFRKTGTSELDLDSRIAGLARRGAPVPVEAPSELALDEPPLPSVGERPVVGRPVVDRFAAAAPLAEQAAEQPPADEPPPVERPIAALALARPALVPTELPDTPRDEAAAGVMPEPVFAPLVEIAPEPAPEAPKSAFPTRPEAAAAPANAQSASPVEQKLTTAREQLIARLSSEIRPERRSLLSRGELAKLVDAAVQAHFVRNSINADPLTRRDLVTAILQELLTPSKPDPEALGNRRSPHRALVESAKAQIQPLVLEHMDVAAAAEMPRPAFEAQLTGWVKELLAETKIQLNFAEQRELVESLIADMLGLGPLEPLMADESITDIMVNGPRQVYIERKGKLELADVHFRDNQHVMNVATKIVSRIGRRIDEAKPLVDARLADGSRVNIIIPPLALDGPSISIRKFSKKTITLDIMAQTGNISPPMSTVLKIAARCRLNILISGGTGSGKTTLLNAMSQHDRPGRAHRHDRGRGRIAAAAAACGASRNPAAQPRGQRRDHHARSGEERAAYAPRPHHPR